MMLHICCRFSLYLIALCFLAQLSLKAEPVLDVKPPITPSPAGITVTFTSASPGNLFLTGYPVELIAHIQNSSDAETATVEIRVQSSSGPVVFYDTFEENLPGNDIVDEPIIFGEDPPLPKGPYIVTVLVMGKKGGGYGETHVGVWDGTASNVSPLFGISYLGQLDQPRALTDLDLFRQAGIGWIRFPFTGWLPQGGTVKSALQYNNFAREITQRGMRPLAVFTPKVTIDPSVDSVQAIRDYSESLLSAAAHCGSYIKTWELLRVPPPAFPPNLRGIDYGEIAKGREALLGFDKTLQAIYQVSEVQRDIIQLSLMKLPGKSDAVGINYNFARRPEYQDLAGKPPTFALPEAIAYAKKATKRVPSVWVTEYGFDPNKGSDLPSDVNQAALIARAILLNKIAGIDHTFWRNNPDSEFDLPLVGKDGSAKPSLLAVRATLTMLEGVTEIKPLITSIAVPELHLYLMSYKKPDKNSKDRDTRNVLVAWSDTERARYAMGLKTKAEKLSVYDLWGNVVELSPVGGTAIFQVDDFPRFVDLGSERKVELRNAVGCRGFEKSLLQINPASEMKINFSFRNDQAFFTGKQLGEIYCNAWPLSDKVIEKKFLLDPFATETVSVPIEIPETKLSGRKFCEVNAQIFIGNRRVGYLTLPVYYSERIPENE